MTAFVVKMKQLPRERWVMALRSEKFPQGHNVLARKSGPGEDQFAGLCCLGVQALIENVPYTVDGAESICIFNFNGKTSEDLPPKEWFSLMLEFDADTLLLMQGASEPSIVKQELGLAIMRRLAAMNDDGKSFTEIADWIEANL